VSNSSSQQRIGVINALRGFAALAVAWGHFVAGQGKYLGPTGKYGYLGVEIFFVISGFVIPWSLYRSGYSARDYGRFLLKRNLRLYPPYLASIVISVLATNFVLVPLFHIPRLTVTGRDLLLHFSYLNDVFHVRWVNVAYWTLAVEFQWYLLVGLAYPLLASRSKLPRFAITVAMLLAYYTVFWDRLVFHYLPVFLIGVFVFQFRAGMIGRREMLGLIAVMTLAMLRISGGLVPLVAVPTALLIAFSGFESRAADRVGDISYSLYLLHLPIGVSVIGCLSHWLPYSSWYLGVLDAVGVAASMGAAWVLFKLVEKPSQELSSSIRFPRRAPKPQTDAQPVPAAIAAAAD
jgi:peptidoglycan/LPS O-acetylase OafA/YrhL